MLEQQKQPYGGIHLRGNSEKVLDKPNQYTSHGVLETKTSLVFRVPFAPQSIAYLIFDDIVRLVLDKSQEEEVTISDL